MKVTPPSSISPITKRTNRVAEHLTPKNETKKRIDNYQENSNPQ